jgi:hypothetical protein
MHGVVLKLKQLKKVSTKFSILNSFFDQDDTNDEYEEDDLIPLQILRRLTC